MEWLWAHVYKIISPEMSLGRPALNIPLMARDEPGKDRSFFCALECQ